MVGAAGAAGALAGPDMDKYNRSCVVCHASGTANAPKTGDAEAWAPRLAKGMPALLESAKKGVPPVMLPMGMCNDCTDEDFTALIEYMSSPAE